MAKAAVEAEAEEAAKAEAAARKKTSTSRLPDIGARVVVYYELGDHTDPYESDYVPYAGTVIPIEGNPHVDKHKVDETIRWAGDARLVEFDDGDTPPQCNGRTRLITQGSYWMSV